MLALAVAGAMTGIAALAIQCTLLWPFTVDDTFITLRYAQRLVEGKGLSWNDGEPPVEGYTSFAWAVVMAVPHLLGCDAETGAKLASLASAAATMVLVAAFAAWLVPANRAVRALTGGVAAAFYALDPASSVHGVSGMETSFFALLLTASFAAMIYLKDHPSRRAACLLAALGLLAGITRPEGNLIFLAGVGILLLRAQPDKRRELGRAVLFGYLLPGGAYFCWRFLTYGFLFPLPLYAKAVHTPTFFAGVPEALGFLHDLVIRNPPFALCMLAGVFFLRGRVAAPLCGAVALFVASLKPAPLMAYEHRYLYPLLPLFCVTAAAGLPMLSARLGSNLSRLRITSSLLACGAIATVALTAHAHRRHLQGSLEEFRSYGEGLRRAHIALGHELRRIKGLDNPRIALLDAGAVAYYSRWNVIDTFGLNDAHIALHGRGDAAYVVSKLPHLIVVVSSQKDQYVPVFGYEVTLASESSSLGYQHAFTYSFAPDYHLRVLVHPGTARSFDGRSAM
jgi:arabinofuranosyltransferase